MNFFVFFLIFGFFFFESEALPTNQLREKFQKFLQKNNITLGDGDFLKKFLNYVTRNDHLEKLRAKVKARGAKYVLSETRFMDWSDEDLKKIVMKPEYESPKLRWFPSGRKKRTTPEHEIPKLRWFPSSRRKRSETGAFDWRDSGYVGPVKDQGQCGSCWAFGAVGPIEVQWRRLGNSGTFSEQQIVDCDTTNSGCNGGSPSRAYNYIIQSGLAADDQYPYASGFSQTEGTCQVPPRETQATIDRYIWLPTIEDMEFYLERVGPFSVKIYVSNDLFYYDSGIFVPDNSTCSPENNVGGHILTVVGYGSENGQDFWIVRNSWGDRWGENGYIRFAKGGNYCVIEAYAYLPVVKGVVV